MHEDGQQNLKYRRIRRQLPGKTFRTVSRLNTRTGVLPAGADRFDSQNILRAQFEILNVQILLHVKRAVRARERQHSDIEAKAKDDLRDRL